MLFDILNGTSCMPITFAYSGKGNYCTRYCRFQPMVELGDKIQGAIKVTLDGERIEYPVPVKQAEYRWNIIWGIEKGLPLEMDDFVKDSSSEKFCIDFSARVMRENWLKIYCSEMKIDQKKFPTNHKGSTWVGWQENKLVLRTEVCVVISNNTAQSLSFSPDSQRFMFSIVEHYFLWITAKFWQAIKEIQETQHAAMHLRIS